MDGQHDTLGGPAESHTPQLDLILGYRAFGKTGYFVQLFCDWEDDKAVFLFPAIQV
jgi:hypothetical protein